MAEAEMPGLMSLEKSIKRATFKRAPYCRCLNDNSTAY